MFSFHYLNDAPIIDIANYPGLDGNANGPTLIAAPDWLRNPPAKYLLYFAHHEGLSITLATSDKLTGPWHIQSSKALTLEDSLFVTTPPVDVDLHPEARAFIAAGADGYYPHIASPDVRVDPESQQLVLYYHGRMHNGLQRTRVALSNDATGFEAQDEILGLPYFRVFRHQDWYYAIAMPGQLYRSRDGLRDFEQGPRITSEPIRHHALLWHDEKWYFFWTRAGDAPERILVSMLDTRQDWHHWRLAESFEVHRPARAWEGAELPNKPSRLGSCMQRVNQLRDPAIFEENGRIYLLYSIAGEQGIGIGELKTAF